MPEKHEIDAFTQESVTVHPGDMVGEVVKMPSEYAVISLPRDAVWVDMTIKVMQNGEITKVGCILDTSAIREAFHEADRNYLPDDAVFTLTEKGRAMAEAMENGQISLFDE
jgi:hypothetical protein